MVRADFFKRAIAFMVDMFIVGVIIGIVSFNFNTSYLEKLNNQVMDVMDNYVDGSIDTIQYVEEYSDIMYDIGRNSVKINVVYLVVYFGYFVLFQYLNGGASIGKKIMGIRIVRYDGENISLGKMIVRTAIINEIFPLIFSICLVFISQGKTYLFLYSIVSFLENIFVIICVFMILYRKDKLSLHDKMSKSMVIIDK